MKRYASILAIVAAAFATPAVAASFADASLTNFLVTLYDLNPGDGIAPSITWNTSSGSFTYVSGMASDPEMSNYQSFGIGEVAPFQPVSGSAQTALSQASAAVTGNGVANGTTLMASGSAQGARTPGQSSSFQGVANAPSASYFTLSPFTLVTFEGDANAHASTTIGFDSAWGAESANATVSLSASGVGALGTGYQTSNDQISISAAEVCDQNQVCTGADQTASGHLAASFVNLTTTTQSGLLSSYALAAGESHVSAVPEPDTYAMFLAGLGLIGALARRRS